jgi:hypothetical protein
MNYRRGSIRVWIVGTTCWIVYWAWHYMTTASSTICPAPLGEIQAITCHYQPEGHNDWEVAAETSPVLTALRGMAIRALGPPICFLIVGIAAFWALAGFSSQTGQR